MPLRTTIEKREGEATRNRDTVAAGRKLRDLVFELSLADAQEIIASGSALKKNSRTSS